MKRFVLISLFIFCIFPAYPADKVADPISDSIIINQLQMDSDSIPSVMDENAAEGEIIFDNTFDDDLYKKKESSKQRKMKKSVKHKSSDKRFHLAEYRINKNESLWTIAKKNGTTVKYLMEINNIKNAELIAKNSVIFVPSTRGVFYKIKPGDTLTTISKKYSIEIDTIADHNNIDNKSLIAGRRIFIPEGSEKIEKNPVREKRNIAANNKSQKKKSANTETDSAPVAENKSRPAGRKGFLLAWPLRGPVTSGFGVRTHPFSGDKKFHCGLDIGAEEGTVVRASGEGRVIFSGWKELYGNMVVVSHKNNYITVYAHNSKNLVSLNEKVKLGQKIALSGKTGAVTGAHLHFEIRKGIVPLNPSRILK